MCESLQANPELTTKYCSKKLSLYVSEFALMTGDPGSTRHLFSDNSLKPRQDSSSVHPFGKLEGWYAPLSDILSLQTSFGST